jgi:ribonuclease BN (tRNA processing enzyme)
MSLLVIFLGTVATVPTVARALPSVVVKRKNEILMFDFGEGMQRQMIRASVGFHRKMKVFVSHMHGDHVLGLPGLLQTMSLLDREKPRPGRKIVYTGDTRPIKSLVELAANADLLIYDAMYDDELRKLARENGHSTASQAAKTAKKAKVKWLVLTHISTRYRTFDTLLEQARKIFSCVDIAEDLMQIDLPLV